MDQRPAPDRVVDRAFRAMVRRDLRFPAGREVTPRGLTEAEARKPQRIKCSNHGKWMRVQQMAEVIDGDRYTMVIARCPNRLCSEMVMDTLPLPFDAKGAAACACPHIGEGFREGTDTQHTDNHVECADCAGCRHYGQRQSATGGRWCNHCGTQTKEPDGPLP